MEKTFNIGRMKAEAIAKAFGVDIEKAAHGIYEDNAENRRLNRVGQEYGHKAEEKQVVSKQPKQGEKTEQEKKTSAATMESAAQGASDEALKRASQDPKAPADVKAAAKKELDNRSSSKKEGVSVNNFDKNQNFTKEEQKVFRNILRHNLDQDSENIIHEFVAKQLSENPSSEEVDKAYFDVGSRLKDYVMKDFYSGDIDFTDPQTMKKLERKMTWIEVAEDYMESAAKKLGEEYQPIFSYEKRWEYTDKEAKNFPWKELVSAHKGNWKSFDKEVDDILNKKIEAVGERLNKFASKSPSAFKDRIDNSLAEIWMLNQIREFPLNGFIPRWVIAEMNNKNK